MNVYKLKENLINTIKGKEALLQAYADRAQSAVYPQNKVYEAMTNVLEINIGELERILADVEKCCEKATADSWIGVDRQGGI